MSSEMYGEVQRSNKNKGIEKSYVMVHDSGEGGGRREERIKWRGYSFSFFDSLTFSHFLFYLSFFFILSLSLYLFPFPPFISNLLIYLTFFFSHPLLSFLPYPIFHFVLISLFFTLISFRQKLSRWLL